MNKIKILWADDEIDLLKPHIIFLEDKGYEVIAVNNGVDAIDEVDKHNFDIIFLDEQMPGLTGLETLTQIKQKRQDIPVVMVTKTEDEFVMDDAIGSQIADYLLKPVNPKQLWLAIKKQVDHKRLVSEKITSQYQREFGKLSIELNDRLDAEEWKNIYRKLVHWEIELEKSNDSNLIDILTTQKDEANSNFYKYINDNYKQWIKNPEDAPILSNKLLYKKVLSKVGKGKPVFFILLDNFRYDQWKNIQPLLTDYFRVVEDDMFYSILPTATNYSRNAIFSGLMPLEIQKNYPDLWKFDEEKGSKNQHEEKYLDDYLKRLRKHASFSFNKITNLEAGHKLPDLVPNMLSTDLNVIVYNFIDLLSHARTEMEVIKELAEDETAFRSLTLSWFKNSPLFETIKKIARQDAIIFISTDHGSIRVKKPSKVIGDKNTTTNLRFKQGKNLNFQPKEVFYAKNPAEIKLPQPTLSSSYIFARDDFYFIYPNNYNYYVNFFNNTFQHGGISLEEMLIPIIELETK
jgi:CheY-like chemotaxis protein